MFAHWNTRNRLAPSAASLGTLLLSAVLFTGCATGKLVLESIPEKATVYIAADSTDTPRIIGETPLTLSSSQLSDHTKSSGPYFLTFKKERFTESTAVVTGLTGNDLHLRMELKNSSGLEDQTTLNEVIDLVFSSQRLALAGRFSDAITALKKVEDKAPQIAATYEIEGGIYYLQRRYAEALDAYRTASKFNPKNPELGRMRVLLEDKLSLSSGSSPLPSSAAPPATSSAQPSPPAESAYPAVDPLDDSLLLDQPTPGAGAGTEAVP